MKGVSYLSELEFSLYTGKGNIKDIAQLYNFYAKTKNYPQLNRIKQIMQIYMKKDDLYKNNTTTLFVIHNDKEYNNKNVKIFPFISYKGFFDLSYRYNIKLFSYLIKEYFIETILVHRDVADVSPEAVQIMESLCKECHKTFRVLKKSSTPSIVLQQIISDKEDAKYATSLLDFPSEIAISTLTAQCNIKCKFCEQAYRNFTYRETDINIFKRIIAAIPEKKFCSVGLTPFMEPLTSKKFLQYVEIACSMRPDANIAFNTNGVLLTEEMSRKLIDLGLKRLSISLNLPDRESYKNFCGKDFFHTIKNNIYSLNKIMKEKNSVYPKVIIQFLNIPPVVGNENELRNIWGEYCDGIYFRNVSTPVGDSQKVKELMEKYPDIIDTQIKREAGTPCASMMHTCGIDYMGYYIPCCPLKHQRDAAGKRKYKFMEIGHVDDMDIETAWKSEKWTQLRCWQMAGLISTCNKCGINQNPEENNLKVKNGILEHCIEKMFTHGNCFSNVAND